MYYVLAPLVRYQFVCYLRVSHCLVPCSGNSLLSFAMQHTYCTLIIPRSLHWRVQVGGHRVRLSRPTLFSHLAFANHLANLVDAYSLNDSSTSSSSSSNADERREPRFVFLSLSAQQPANLTAKVSMHPTSFCSSTAPFLFTCLCPSCVTSRVCWFSQDRDDAEWCLAPEYQSLVEVPPVSILLLPQRFTVHCSGCDRRRGSTRRIART